MLRWRRQRGEEAPRPLHTAAAMLAELGRLGRLGSETRTETLWRLVLSRLTTDEQRGQAIGEAVRATELRRIADGTLRALGFVLAAEV
jgi:hypothetical protein